MTPTPHPALAARRARVRRIRGRVATGATALFLALFSGLYVQMATGNDPALGAESAQVATTATGTAASDAGSSDTTSSDDTTTDDSGESDAAPMTTSAS